MNQSICSSREHPAVPLRQDQVDGVHVASRPVQVVGAERVGEQLAEGASVEEQLGAAVLVEQLPAPPAGHERLAATVDAGHRDQAAAAGGVQRRDEPALGAEGEP